MIKYLQRKEIDDTRWNKAIAHAANGLPYGYTWYLDVVSPQWHALVLNDYEAIMPLTCRSKFGLKYLFPPFFTQQLGVFSSILPSQELVQQMLEAIPQRYRFVEIHLNHTNHFHHPDFVLSPRVNMELSLDKPYQELKAGYTDNLRRNLQKAEKNGLRVKQGIDAASVVNFFRENMGDKVETLKVRDYEMMEELCLLLASKEVAETYYVTNIADEILATALFVHSHNRHINLLPSANEGGKQLGATALLLDYVIKKHAGTETTMDFEGSMIGGITRFYSSFGASDVPYYRLNRKVVPWYIRLFK